MLIECMNCCICGFCYCYCSMLSIYCGYCCYCGGESSGLVTWIGDIAIGVAEVDSGRVSGREVSRVGSGWFNILISLMLVEPLEDYLFI